jgi:adenylosuccinate lyase
MPHKRNPITGERLTGWRAFTRQRHRARMWPSGTNAISATVRWWIIFPIPALLDYMLVTLTVLWTG